MVVCGFVMDFGFRGPNNNRRRRRTEQFRERFANDASLDDDDDDVLNDDDDHPDHHHPMYSSSSSSSLRHQHQHQRDCQDVLDAAGRAGIRIRGRMPEVEDFFFDDAMGRRPFYYGTTTTTTTTTGEPATTRTRRHHHRHHHFRRFWIRKRRENEKETTSMREQQQQQQQQQQQRLFEEETRRAMEESRRAWNAAAMAGGSAGTRTTLTTSGRERGRQNAVCENDDEEDEEKLMKIATEMSKANRKELNSIQQLVCDLDMNSRLKAANVMNTTTSSVALEATGRSLGRKFAARFHLTRCLSEFDALDETADGFYDFWRNENSSTSLLFGGEDNPLPDLEDLLSLRKTCCKDGSAVNGNEEDVVAYVVDRKSDDILNSLDELARKIRVQNPSDVFTRARALALLVSNRLGGACETETKAFSIRATAMRDEMKLKKINASCVIHVGHLSFGAEKQRAILFKALASHANVPCRLLRGGVYCDGDEDCAKIVIVNNIGTASGAAPQKTDDDAFFASLGTNVDVREIDLLRNVGKMTSSGGRKTLSSVEKEFFGASTASASSNDINFDFFSASSYGDNAKKKAPSYQQKQWDHEKDIFDENKSTKATPSSSSASLLDLSDVMKATTTTATTTSPTKALTAKEEAAEKKKILIRRQAERILEVQEAEEEKEYTREIELKFRHKFHKKWDNVVKNLSLGETLEVFGVEVKDKKSTNELRKAYRKALMKFHPDRLARGSVSLQDKVNGEEIFKIINGKMENS